MNFGLQDEVCGHCGEWVSFDDLDRIQRHYPELADLVREHMLGGWGLSDHTGTRLQRSTKHQNAAPFSISQFIIRLSIFLAMTSVTLLAVTYLYEQYTSSKINEDVHPNITAVNRMLGNGDITRYHSYIETYMPLLLPMVTSSSKSYAQWIPHLRRYAFNGTGEIMGLKPKFLRGQGADDAPLNCSMKSWRSRWLSSRPKWADMTAGTVVKDTAMKTLLWDPHWIRRRSQVAGWVQPMNYHTACLLMAQKSLMFLLTELTPYELKMAEQFNERLTTLISIINQKERPNIVIQKHESFLPTLNCLDTATKQEQLNQCLVPYQNSTKIHSTLKLFHVYNEFRIALESLKSPTNTLITKNFETTTQQIKRINPITGLDYRAELRFINLLQQSRGKLEAAQAELKKEFSQLKIP